MFELLIPNRGGEMKWSEMLVFHENFMKKRGSLNEMNAMCVVCNHPPRPLVFEMIPYNPTTSSIGTLQNPLHLSLYPLETVSISWNETML